MTRKTEVVRRPQELDHGVTVDARFLPIGIILVLLPLCAEIVEGVVRLFVWAALRLGGAL